MIETEWHAGGVDQSQNGLVLHDRYKVNCAAVSDDLGFVSFIVDAGQIGASHIVREGGEQIRSVTIDYYLVRRIFQPSI